jgi:homospermidine synthase
VQLPPPGVDAAVSPAERPSEPCPVPSFDKPIVIIGFGSIGKGVLPLILRHIDAPRERMVVISPDERSRKLVEFEGIRFEKMALTAANLRQVLQPLIQDGGFVVNVSVEVSSLDLIRLCQECGALYIDTCIEPWAGVYTDPGLTMSQRSNYALREQALALRGPGPTAIIAHGANPGMVSHFVKRALLHLADAEGFAANPTDRREWAALARHLGVQGIHISERDTQRCNTPKQQDEFVNTWSIDGFLAEGLQPAELGWGTHEKSLPPDGAHHVGGQGSAIYLKRPGACTRVRSWTPMAGPIHGYLITHNEAISISDFLTLRDGDRLIYRPTCHYAYHPCDDAILSLHELQGRAMVPQGRFRLAVDEIVDGYDELGVMLYGHRRNAFWMGSRLSIQEARRMAPYQNATGMQVTAAVVAGMIWAIENPHRGVVEAEDLDHERILGLMQPYLGQIAAVYTDWTPLTDREDWLFPEDLDRDDPWQFANVIVR